MHQAMWVSVQEEPCWPSIFESPGLSGAVAVRRGIRVRVSCGRGQTSCQIVLCSSVATLPLAPQFLLMSWVKLLSGMGTLPTPATSPHKGVQVPAWIFALADLKIGPSH